MKVKSRAGKWRFFQGEYRGPVEKQLIERIERRDARDRLKAVLQAEVEKDAGMADWTMVRLAAVAGIGLGDVRGVFWRFGMLPRKAGE